jgi:hypothetical protein
MLQRHNTKRQKGPQTPHAPASDDDKCSADDGAAGATAERATGAGKHARASRSLGQRAASGAASGAAARECCSKFDAPGTLDALLHDGGALSSFLDDLPQAPPLSAAAMLQPFAQPSVPIPPRQQQRRRQQQQQQQEEEQQQQQRAADAVTLPQQPPQSFPATDPLLLAAAAAAGTAAAGAAPTRQGTHPLLQVVVSHIKLHDIAPNELPREMADLVRSWLGPLVMDALAYVRPGCTLLTVHALVPADAEQENFGSAVELAQTLASVAPQHVAHSRFEVHDAAGGVAHALGGAVADHGTSAAHAQQQAGLASPLPALQPLALCSAQPGTLTAAAPAQASGQLRGYCGGVVLQLPPAAAHIAAGDAVAFQLAASGCVRTHCFDVRAFAMRCMLLSCCLPPQAGGRCAV